MKLANWAIFISGNGSNLQALIDLSLESKTSDSNLPKIKIGLVVSSQEKAFGLERAKKAGISTLTLDKKINWDQLHQNLCANGIEQIFLLGFLKILPAEFIQKWDGKILNLHPSLLPAYKGLHAIEKSFEEKSDMGVSIHEVIADLDAGPIVAQKVVFTKEFLKSENPKFDFVKQRIHEVEHELVRKVVGVWKPKKQNL